jgi:hypothetical protein
MRIALTTLISCFLLAMSAWAQESDSAAETQDEAAQDEAEIVAAEEADESAIDDPELDDPELDEQGYDPTEEEDFRPSEDIRADESIAFPTDI